MSMLSYESMRLLQEMPKTGGRYKIIVQCSAVQCSFNAASWGEDQARSSVA